MSDNGEYFFPTPRVHTKQHFMEHPLSTSTILVNLSNFVNLECSVNFSWSGVDFGEFKSLPQIKVLVIRACLTPLPKILYLVDNMWSSFLK